MNKTVKPIVGNDNGYANIKMCINKCCKSGKIGS